MTQIPVIYYAAAAVVLVCYSAAENYKRRGTHPVLIPLFTGLAGGLLGLVMYILIPTERLAPVASRLDSVIVGAVAGALSTWIYEAAKGIRKFYRKEFLDE